METIGAGRREIAENQLSSPLLFGFLPNSEYFVDDQIDLAFRMDGGKRVHQAHIERRLASVARDLENIVVTRIHAASFNPVGAFHKASDIGFELRRRRRHNNLVLPTFER